jgi:hypothetical protein
LELVAGHAIDPSNTLLFLGRRILTCLRWHMPGCWSAIATS